ncbi:ABC-type cobalamin/Fe3+-siderophore transport system, ATPase component [Bernardetia litoralis DSM 6794]|uniref:ABC-type cobalamin/Fe3+-siderophore transport system, ATPase component n=1 Tax=Bernardetia litoralis (strain ATCC 23117 / DSM 6794 / NBRC 15988 / NCIMB 1366 / Fx l1 / Sio-4) TaxID=880071 RepID=I4APQ6_BERLS|nr:ABC transporter ATP-binding protein [Bernardetia litoralis]AFM05941.1 ABC-type cobalamin/Fe3+-siderophore transport system, ATPase component [Bernardetia litoralis DSM 6794]
MLKTQNLTIGYPSKIILENLNLHLEKGKLTALLGINGAGKSTLLRTIAGVQKPILGNVFLNYNNSYKNEYKSIQKLSKKEIAKKISLVLTEQAATTRLTVKELIALGRYPHTGWNGNFDKEDKNKIDWAIEAVGMNEYADVPIGELSDGLRQKTMIGRALAQEGDILLLDEPTAHLDLVNRSEVMLLLSQIATEFDKAILVSTHELDLILQIAHKLWLISSNSENKLNKKLFVGLTEELVLNGELANAFIRPPLYFDREKGNFKILNKEHKITYFIEGDAIGTYWTKLALEKRGIYSEILDKDVNNSNLENNLIIKVVSQNSTSWKWIFERKEFENLEEFLEFVLIDESSK